MSSYPFFRGAIGVAAFLASSSVRADDAPPDITVTASRSATDVAGTPGGAALVPANDYADKAVVSLRDALAFSPGVYLQPRFGQEVRLSIRGSGLSRGFHMRGLTLLQDGVPTNLADDNGDFLELDPIFFSVLEVYRGANALRLGSGTLGGAINGVTPTGRDSEGLSARLDYGSFNQRRAFVSGGVERGAGDAWGAISIDGSDGDRAQARRTSLRFRGNAGLALSQRVSTRFYASVNAINQQIPGALTLGQTLATPRIANPANLAGNQSRDIDSIRLQSMTRIALDTGTIEIGAFINARSLYHPIFQLVDQESVDRGGSVRADFVYGPVSLSAGGEYRYGTTVSRRFVNAAGTRGARTFEAYQQARTLNIYGEGRLTPLPGLTLIAGGVYANGFRAQHETFNAAAGGDRDVRARATFSEFSPKFGVIVQPSKGIQFYANYNRSAEFPTFTELAQISQFVPLRAQTAWTVEVGSRGRTGAVEWDVSLYRADVTGEMLQFTVNSSIPASTFNASRTRHQGIEAGLTLTPAPWLRIRQNYQYADFRFRDDPQYGANRLPVVPQHVWRGEVRLGTDDRYIASDVEWVPQGAFADYRNSVRVPGYALLGLRAGWRVVPGVEAFADLRNLTAKRAVGDISAVITATPSSAIYNPVEARSASAGLRLRF